METATITLLDLHKDILILMQKINKIEVNVEEINNDLHQVRPEYIQKLDQIKAGKQHHFENKTDFLNFLENEI